MQLSSEAGLELSVCLVEKGSEIGAHVLSGAIFDPHALNELIPDWEKQGAPLDNPVTSDEAYMLTSSTAKIKLPNFLVPGPLHNEGYYATSLGSLCRWLGEHAESLGAIAALLLHQTSGPALRGLRCSTAPR